MFYVPNVIEVQWVTMDSISGLYSYIQKSWEWWHLCAGCNKKETCCTRVSAADTFSLQQVTDSIHGCVQVGANWPDVRRCCSEDQCCDMLL